MSRTMKTRRERRSASGQRSSRAGGMQDVLDAVDHDRACRASPRYSRSPSCAGDSARASSAGVRGTDRASRPGSACRSASENDAHAVVVPGHVVMVVMIVVMRGRVSFFRQPGRHVGDFLIRLVEPAFEQARGRGLALGRVENRRGRIERVQPRDQRVLRGARVPAYRRDRSWSAPGGRRPRPASPLRDARRACESPFTASTSVTTPSSRKRITR